MKQQIFLSLVLLSCIVWGQTPISKTVALKTVASKTIKIPLQAERPSNESAQKTWDAGIGETAGALSVSNTGAAQYTIPIAVPPGINGVEPAIAISYNSQSGPGIAGYGWGISGLSSITRMSPSTYHDNRVSPVQLNREDRFSLDGERLVLKSGTYGVPGAVYETENHSNIRIKSYLSHTDPAVDGPKYFIVEYPDGSKGHYGITDDSRSKAVYALSYWENPQGIKIEYEYEQTASSSGDALHIASIKYGHLASETKNRIDFVMTSSYKRETAFIGGERFSDGQKRLSEIKIYHDNERIRTYDFEYIRSSLADYSLLDRVQEYNDTYESHSAITFTYPDMNGAVSYEEMTTNISLNDVDQRNASTVTLDYTGNGKMDFVIYPKDRDDRDKFWVFEGIQPEETNQATEVQVGAFETLLPASIMNHTGKVLSQQALTVVQNTTNFDVDFRVGIKGTNGAWNENYTKTWDAPTFIYHNSLDDYETRRVPQKYVSGDFNGDGLSDVLAISRPYITRTCTPCWNNPNPSCSNCYTQQIQAKGVNFIDLKRDATTTVNVGVLETIYRDFDKLLPGDMDGDGKTELYHLTDGHLYIYGLDENNSLELLWQEEQEYFVADLPFLMGDYNGDGNTDFIVSRNNGREDFFLLYYSTGNGYITNTIFNRFELKEDIVTNSQWRYNLIPLDVNGDGRTDILEYETLTLDWSDEGSQKIRIWLNSAPSSTRITGFENIGSEIVKYGHIRHYPIPLFLSNTNNNGNLEMATISHNWITHFEFNLDSRNGILLESVENNGMEYHIEYESLVNGVANDIGMPIYEADYSVNYPYVEIQNSLGTKVVSKLTRKVTGIPDLKQYYNYKGGVHHLQGLGFQGFRAIAVSNWHSEHAERLFNVSFYNPTQRGLPVENYLRRFNFEFDYVPSDILTRSAFVHNYTISSSKVFKSWLVSETNTDNLLGTSITTDYLYDSYNNPRRITTDYDGDGSQRVDITYSNSLGSTYYIGRKTKEVTRNTIGGDTFSSEVRYTYHGYLVASRSVQGNQSETLRETFGYDSAGNIRSKSVIPEGMPARTIRFEYDSSSRFIDAVIDVEGLRSEYHYEDRTGNLLSETNPFGQTTSYGYDGWNRAVSTIDYLGNNKSITYDEVDHHYIVTETHDDGSMRIKEYDVLKRLIKQTENNTLGELVTIEYRYDKFDRVYMKSEPYKGSNPTDWNTFNYDHLGRLEQQVLHTGQVIDISYDGLSVTVDNGTKVVTTTRDAMGNIQSVTDPGGTIYYTYFGNGNLKRTDYDGVIVSFEQDGWGRKTKTIDPSAGEFRYEYNGFGEITKETTPKGVTKLTYSAIGKLEKKEITGDQTSMLMRYSYDAATRFLSRIALSDDQGYTGDYTYDYDSYARLRRSTEENSYAQFSKNYTYDGFGRIAKETSYAKLLANNKSTSKTIVNEYAYGTLKTIKEDGTNAVLWNILSLNDRGQTTALSLGNHMIERNSYEAGYMETATVEKNTPMGPQQLMRLENDFDIARGTLRSRANSLFNWTEEFEYDGLNRLESFSNNYGDQYHTYDAAGRINYNSIVGDYQYQNNSFHLDTVDLNNQGDLYYQQHELQQITYNAFKKPVDINQEGEERIGFIYNAFLGRAHKFYGGTEVDILDRSKEKHYASSSDMEITYDATTDETVFVNYIGGNAYSAPMFWRSKQGGGSTEQGFHYLHRDYLGSILMITDAQGTVKEKRHFDAWGVLEKVADGAGNALEELTFLDRGYTGHEHLEKVHLIHMNGRLYDAKLRRFLSPDNYIQDLYNTQNYNRYGYVYNNPLMYADPSGELAEWIVIGAIAVAALLKATLAPVPEPVYADDAPSSPPSSQTSSIASEANSGSRRIASGMASPHYQTSLENNFVTPYSSFSGANAGSSFFNAGAENTVSGSRFGNWIKRNIARAVAFKAGADAGFVAGALSTANFVGGLFTGESWVAMGQGFVNMAILGSPVPSAQQVMMRAQIAQGVGDYVSSLPNKSAFELGYVAGYASEKFTESVLLSYGTGVVVNGVKSLAAAERAVIAVKGLTKGANVVYQGIDAAGNVRYVGITSRNPVIRFSEHLNTIGTGKELLNYRVIEGATDLTRIQARVWEQGLINQYGLGKEGGQLLNKINSIARKNWWKYNIK